MESTKTLQNKIEELTTAQKAIKTELETIRNTLYGLPLKELAERIDLHKRQDELYIQEQDTTELLAIYQHNWECATLAEILPTICEIISKYDGKQAGERTREKIRDEIKEKTGFFAYISTQINGGYISLNLSTSNYSWHNGKDIYPQNGAKIIDEYNTLHAITVDDLTTGTRGYIDNPEQAQQERKATAQKIKELKQQIDELAKEHNKTSVKGLPYYYITLNESK